MAESDLYTPDGIAALKELVLLFAAAKDETFALFDQDFDSAAESQAAKDGWSSAVGGVSMLVIMHTVIAAGVANGLDMK